jgi:citrate lyase subunit beta/citryl-CoA lyase
MRTWLFAPGHEPHKVEKALAGDADMVVLDWEDAVPAAEKAMARRVTLEALAGRKPPELRHVAVRVNQPSGEHYAADRDALADLLLGAIMVPKVEEVAQAREVAELEVPLVLLLESARGVERAFDLARAHPWVRWLAFGPLDLLADIGGHWTPEGEETSYARQLVPIAARAARLHGALDGPWPQLRDLDGLRADTARGRRMGYAGRIVIHPAQVGVVRQVFAPSPDELAYARKVVEAARRATEEGRGAIAVDGRFVDPPVVRWAEGVVRSGEE